MSETEMLESFKKLDKLSQIHLVEDMWDTIEPDSVPPPQWHVRETEQRYADYKSDKVELLDWNDLHQEIRNRLK